MTNLNSVLQRDPFADSTLVVNDEGITIRLIDGSRNNLDQVSLGIPNTPLLRLSPIEYEDGIQSPAGIAFDAEGNALIGIDGNTVTRQPIPIFTQAEA
ncbi:MAG: heme peroxidase, partial [Moorea sp. SIO3E2]|nr:heme peroxidase [Moorena sp. SIO3E2]